MKNVFCKNCKYYGESLGYEMHSEPETCSHPSNRMSCFDPVDGPFEKIVFSPREKNIDCDCQDFEAPVVKEGFWKRFFTSSR
jgi:hypothetical protein